MQQRVRQDTETQVPQDPLAELARLIGGSDPFAGQMPEEHREAIDRIIETDDLPFPEPPLGEPNWERIHWSVCRLKPAPLLDAFFFRGSILAGKEHVFELPDNEQNGLLHSSMEPMRDAFFYRDIHAFHIAEN
ncbi:MAG: hypothetical protein AAB480_04205 [Patescibacteria group bacterium]